MFFEDCGFMIDRAVEFFGYFRVEGWFHCENDTLLKVKLEGKNHYFERDIVDLPHPGVDKELGPNKGFCVYALMDDSNPETNLTVVFQTWNGRTIRVGVDELCNERKCAFAGRPIIHKFIETVNSTPNSRLLDIGGRSRSGVDYSKLFHAAKCTVLDVLPGENVDVVGDAHAMSLLFPPNSFDAIFSSSVFEHLLMPWVVAAEMSRVLCTGGIAFIATHQTVGMHDQPWDFWRFSDTAWDGLFNRLTGFEILDRALENPQFIIPYFWSPELGEGPKNSLGFIGSSVLVKKIGEPEVDWGPMMVSEVVTSFYPSI